MNVEERIWEKHQSVERDREGEETVSAKHGCHNIAKETASMVAFQVTVNAEGGNIKVLSVKGERSVEHKQNVGGKTLTMKRLPWLCFRSPWNKAFFSAGNQKQHKTSKLHFVIARFNSQQNDVFEGVRDYGTTFICCRRTHSKRNT